MITGGSRGLGLVMARMFADEGARVVLLARDMARTGAGGSGPGVTRRGSDDLSCDVRRRGDVRAAIDQVVERWRAVDVLINNAGVIQVGPLEQMEHEDFENAMATHFWGPLHLMLELMPIMRRRGFGRIVNIASIGGRVAVPHSRPYSASKFALIGLSDAVRAELDAARHPRHTVCARADADRLADERADQGAARGRVRLVRDRRARCPG